MKKKGLGKIKIHGSFYPPKRTLGSVAQLAEALDSKSRGSGFDSQRSHHPPFLS